MHEFRVTEKALLLEYLFKHLAHLKRTKIRQILKYGSVRVNGRVTTSHAYVLKSGDTVDVLKPQDAWAQRLKEEMDLRVVYEDDQIIVAEKPSGLLTMGTDTEKERTLYFQLTEYVRAKSPDGMGRVFIVHRLDRDASGLVLFAKTEEAKKSLQQNWDAADKRYYAVTEGTPDPAQGTIESHLKEDKSRRVYSTRGTVGGSKLSITHYKVIENNGYYALLDVRLETGRKNQIRVHLSELGHPVAGDRKYGAGTDLIRRLALHAYHLGILHPTTGQKMQFHIRMPSGFRRLFGAGRGQE